MSFHEKQYYSVYSNIIFLQSVPMQIEGQQIQLEDGSHIQLQDGQLQVMKIIDHGVVVCEFVTKTILSLIIQESKLQSINPNVAAESFTCIF